MKNKTSWKIDSENSEIGFKAMHLMISRVKGIFKNYEGTIFTSANDFETAVINLQIDSSSVNTGNPERDRHLISSDFFDSENHKYIKIKSTSIGKPDKDGNRDLWVYLSVKGNIYMVKLSVQFGLDEINETGKETAYFMINGIVKRKEVGLGWSGSVDKGGLLVGDDIIIFCRISLIKEEISLPVSTANLELTASLK